MELAICPCGKTPTAILIDRESNHSKWAFAYGDCCGQWYIQFQAGYLDDDSPELKQAAQIAWNNTPREVALSGKLRFRNAPRQCSHSQQHYYEPCLTHEVDDVDTDYGRIICPVCEIERLREELAECERALAEFIPMQAALSGKGEV